MKKYVYLIVTNDDVSLPCACFDTLLECSSFFGVSIQRVSLAVLFGGVCCSKYRVERVYL